MQMSILKGMKYYPFGPDLCIRPHIMVDSASVTGTILELSHWPGNKTPNEIKADTSAEICIKFLQSDLWDQYRNIDTVSVSNDHYDVDGLLSLWSLIYPNEALEKSNLIIDTATCGDFDKFTTHEAVKINMALDFLEARYTQPRIASSNWSTEQITQFIYSNLLDEVNVLLDDIENYQPLWHKSFDIFEKDRQLFDAGKFTIVENSYLDYAVVNGPKHLHPYLVNAATNCSLIVSSQDNRDLFSYYRYESFVEMISRKVNPRIYQASLIYDLNEIEKSHGTWASEDIVTAHPRLKFYTDASINAKSSVSLDTFLPMLERHLREGLGDTSKQWSHTKGLIGYTDVLPESIKVRGSKWNS